MKITIGIPAFNEEKNIAKIITSLKKITDSIIICDDGSSDMTSEIANQLDVIVVRHDNNLGYGAAIKTIFKKAKEIESDILVTFDADGQHRIEDISTVTQPIIKEKMDNLDGIQDDVVNMQQNMDTMQSQIDGLVQQQADYSQELSKEPEEPEEPEEPDY